MTEDITRVEVLEYFLRIWNKEDVKLCIAVLVRILYALNLFVILESRVSGYDLA